MDLTLAIPAHDDLDHLTRLLGRVRVLGLADHVVVVDDGSATPIRPDPLLAATGLDPRQLTLLRNEHPRGPGVARNMALEHVPTDHMLFLDADDLPTQELPDLLRDLDGQDFDFCIFQHHDTRMEQDHVWGQTRHDQALWHAAGTDLGALSKVSPAAATYLSRTANYPWNKIYRTAFLRDNGIGCSKILVHEDVELHWRSFIGAETVLASDRIGVIHAVQPHGGRLTNRTGPERLDLFGPLARIAADLETHAAARHLALPFHGFVLGLFDWIFGNLAPEHHDRFNALVQAHVTAHVPPALLEEIRAADPERIARVLARAGLG